MKKYVTIVFTILAACVLLTVSAAAKEQSAVSATAHFEYVERFITLGEKPDVSQGYIDFVLDGDVNETVYLDDTRFEAPAAADKVGIYSCEFSLYNRTFTIDFMVIDDSVHLTTLADFRDLKASYWGYTRIKWAVAAGFFSGESKTAFNPAGTMTRAQFCQMIYNIYKGNKKVMKSGTAVGFSDVPKTKWCYEAISACAKAKIVTGVGDGSFNPDAPITRQDAAIIMMKILDGEALENADVEENLRKARKSGIAAGDFDKTSEYAKKAVSCALGVIYFGDDDGNITPKSNITRTECCALVTNYYFNGYNEPERKKLVYLSPENRTSNAYAGVNTNESDEMNKVAEKMKPMLEALGYDVYIADRALSIKEGSGYYRQMQAGNMGADVYVALHTNAVSGDNSDGHAHGTVCYYNGKNKGAKELSQAIYDSLSTVMTWNTRGIHDDVLESKLNNQTPYAEVRLPTMANLICEVEFHDCKQYALWITQNTETIAKLVTKGIDNYFKAMKKG